MGQIKKIIYKSKVPVPLLNTRFTVELCENVHLHYRDLRLEFPKEEFLQILRHLKKIDEKTVEDFAYANDAFKCLVNDNNLPPSTEFNDRLQIEEQVQGHYHLHYRNLRLEMKNLLAV